MRRTQENETLSKALDMIADSQVNLSELFAEKGLLKQMIKGLVERALAAEMKEHLGYDKYERSECENSRNGVSKKKVLTESGHLEIGVPRDRSGEFEPSLIANSL